MKNLQNFNVQELSAKEVNELNGGSWKWVFRAVSAVYEGIKYSVSDPEVTERIYGGEVDNPYSGIRGGL